jgi:acetoin:2,6-dichlorophenolindophenol oxidoreductase subunit beta
MKIISYKDALLESMSDALQKSEKTVIMGQGVNDPTAIFGTTEGLKEKFGGERIIDMPIAEEGMTGFALGAALNGLYPIQTHIRVDFLLVAMNQIVNMIAKYKYMYGGAFQIPMLIRAVVGRSWGQGPQHSQSLQSLFAHIPGLTVIMPSTAQSVIDSYTYAVQHFTSPVISIEHRFLYDYDFHVSEKEDDGHQKNPFSAKVVQSGSDVSIVATSYMVEEAQKAANWVKEHDGISCEIIDLHVVSDVDHELILKSVAKTGKLIIADTGWKPYGVAAEVCRGIVTQPQLLKRPVIQHGMAFTPCPTSHALEDAFYPDMGDLVNSIYKHVYSDNHGKELPTKEYITKQSKEFKGPF